MRPLFRFFWLPIYRWWALRYMRRERTYAYEGIRVQVPPGVFHPGFYFSTPIFITFLKGIIAKRHHGWAGLQVLDVGTGSGLLALFAAKNGATTTALDINPLAVETARRNAALNQLPLTVIESDLFDALPQAPFDFVLVNPPYYPRRPRDAAEHAFFAGENLEYFEKFFRQLPGFLQGDSHTWMVLSEDCDFDALQEIAGRYNFILAIVFERRKWGERLFVAEVLPKEKS